MKVKINPLDAGLEVLTIQRTRKEEILLVWVRLSRGDGSACIKLLLLPENLEETRLTDELGWAKSAGSREKQCER